MILGTVSVGGFIFGCTVTLLKQRLIKIKGLKWAIFVVNVILLEMIYIEKVIFTMSVLGLNFKNQSISVHNNR
jgi:hypothetical protein